MIGALVTQVRPLARAEKCEDVSVGARTGLGLEGVGAANLSCCSPTAVVVMGGSHGEDSPSICS